MKEEDRAGVYAVGAVGMVATSLVDIDSLWEGPALKIVAIPAVGEAGGVENVDAETVVYVEAVAVGKG